MARSNRDRLISSFQARTTKRRPPRLVHLPSRTSGQDIMHDALAYQDVRQKRAGRPVSLFQQPPGRQTGLRKRRSR